MINEIRRIPQIFFASSQLVALLRCDELIGIAEVHVAKHRHDLEAEHIATASSALPSACRARRFAAAALGTHSGSIWYVART